MSHLTWEAWKDSVFQEMLNGYSHIFGATESEPQISREDIDWEQWRPWHGAGLSPVEAIEKALVTD